VSSKERHIYRKASAYLLFEDFQDDFGKTYESFLEERKRFDIF